jgi:hypothetical protein
MTKAASKSTAKSGAGPTAPSAKSAASATVSMEPMPEPSPQEIKKESNPFTDRDWRMWTYAWAGFMLRLMLVFGATFSVYQYLAARQEKRVERTMLLVERWEQPQYQEAQKTLKQRLTVANEKYASLLGQKPSEKELAVYYRKIGQEVMTPEGGVMPLPEFQAHFDRVVYFLNRVSACATANLCAPELADEYFKDYALSFWNYFAGYIQQQRNAGSANYAQPLETYLKGSVPALASAK